MPTKSYSGKPLGGGRLDPPPGYPKGYGNSVIAVDGDEKVDLENTQLYKIDSRPSIT